MSKNYQTQIPTHMHTSKSMGWLLLIGAVILTQCKPKPTDLFEGRVVKFNDEGLSEAVVEINGTRTTSGKDGTFILKLKKTEKGEFHLQVRKDGYAPYLQQIGGPSKNLKVTLYEATVFSVDPSNEIKVTDTKSKNRPGPITSHANWKKNPLGAVPLVVRNGKVVDIGFSPDMARSLEYLLNRKAGEGMTLTIPAKSLVNGANQREAKGNVNVAISTIDILSPGAMPGDYALRREGREAGYLVSYGAGFIDIYDNNGDRYQLKKGAKATITIPVDGSQLLKGDSLPARIPLFLFDEKALAWIDHGSATLTKDRKAYEGEVSHFSVFNVDIDKVHPACVNFQNGDAAVPTSPYQLELIVPKGATLVDKTLTINEPGGSCLVSAAGAGNHVILRLPPNTDICMIYFDNANAPLATRVIQSSDEYPPGSPPTCSPTGYASGAVFCSSDTWNTITDAIVAVPIPGASTKKVKWVSSVAVDHFQIVTADPSTCVATTTTVALTNVTTTPLTIGGLTLVEAEIPFASTGNFKVQGMDVSNGVAAESNCLNF